MKSPIHLPLIDSAMPLADAVSGADEIGTFAFRRAGPGRDRPGVWLQCAAAGLCVLAAAAAAVSFTAQYRLVYAARRLPLIAALEAAIPDAAALVFACLGVALALHGRHAIRARVLNVAVGGRERVHERDRGRAGLAGPGGLDDAPGRLRAGQRHADRRRPGMGDRPPLRTSRRAGAEEATLLAMAGGLLLWLLRLSMAPASTLRGFRAWVLEECPVAPGRRAPARQSRPRPCRCSRRLPSRRRGSGPRGGTKTARFLALVTERHGPLAAIPLETVAKTSAALAPEVNLNAGSARAALRRAVLAARNGDPR